MTKKEIIEKLEEREVFFNSKSTRYELGKILFKLELLLALRERDIENSEKWKIKLRELEVERYVK